MDLVKAVVLQVEALLKITLVHPKLQVILTTNLKSRVQKLTTILTILSSNLNQHGKMCKRYAMKLYKTNSLQSVSHLALLKRLKPTLRTRILRLLQSLASPLVIN
jgi:hypothetical protein